MLYLNRIVLSLYVLLFPCIYALFTFMYSLSFPQTLLLLPFFIFSN